jgi:RNA polymerase sigma-70 factor (ECF subfamily)
MANNLSNLESLIERWLSGDQRAAESLYNLHRDRTYRLAYALLGNAEDAEEAAQDTLGYALLHIDRFDQKRSKFTTWLHMITVSRSRDLLRKRRPLPTVSLTTWLKNRYKLPAPGPSPEQLAEKGEIHSTVWGAVQKLNPMLREAIVLRHWGRHTYQEIGEIVGCPMKTAQSRVRLAHQQLAQSLAEVELQEIIEKTS